MRKIYIKQGSKIAKWAAGNLNSQDVAIVIWNTIFIYGTTVEDFLQNKRWLRHEIEHVHQWRRNGFFLYIIKYLYYSLRYGYHDNPYEVQARKAEWDTGALDEYVIESDTLYARSTGRMAGIATYTRLYESLGWIVGAALLYLIIAKSVRIPVTHDEVAQITVFARSSLSDILFYTTPSPTNHILDSILIKISAVLMGDSLWVARLPSNLAFVLFYVYTLKWSRKFFQKDMLAMLTTIGLLCLVCYSFDFYSVARGYGLALSMQLAASYHLYNYLYSTDIRQLAKTQFFLLLMVLGNFSWLGLWALIEIILLVHSLIRQRSRHFALSIGAILIVLGLVYTPITRLLETGQFKFKKSLGFMQDTFEPLVSLYYYDYQFWHFSYEYVASLLIGVSIALLIYTYLFRSRKQLWLFPVLFFGTAVIGNPYLSGRTALMFYPMMGLIFLGLLRMLKDNRVSYLIVSAVILLFTSIQFGKNYAQNSVLEWRYDQYTYMVLDQINEIHGKNTDSLYLGLHWKFYPSISYHAAERGYDWLVCDNFRQVPIAEETQYYYGFDDERARLDSAHFVEYSQIGSGQKLYIRDYLKSSR